MATQRKEIDGAELAELVRDLLGQTDALSLAELRAALADEEGAAVQAEPDELAAVLNALIRAGEATLSAGDTDTPIFLAASSRRA